jgi:glycerol-3-phosphate dehydrogenase (NAD(P)+)
MNIVIAGHGAFGSALGQVLTENQHQVTFYDPFHGDPTPPATFQTTEVIVIAVPSEHLPEFLPVLNSHYRDQPIILATKGVLNLSPFDGKLNQLSVISGPGFAVDIIAHQATTLTATDQLILDLFTTDYLTLELTADRAGVLACGALKNIYAIGAGLRQLSPESEAFATFIEQSLAELRHLLPAFDGHPDTADLACGIGDLILTCGSTKSRNYTYGLNLATDPSYQPEQTTEGLSALHLISSHPALPPIITDIKRRVLPA